MKKAIAILAAAALVVGVSSCGDDAVLSKSAAKNALKKEAVFAKDYATKTFNTGYYEITENELENLEKLQAAGVITFNVETIIEKVQKRNYSYWSGYSYYTVDKEHLFATVELTEAGNKYIVENPTRQREDITKDFKDNDNYEEIVPEYLNAAVDVCEEIVEAPVEETVEETVVAQADSVAADSVAEPVEAVPAPVEPANPNAAYEAACAKINKVEHNVLLGRFELIKVKEVFCTEEMANNGIGKCRVLYTFKDKTPFGYVYGAPKQGYIMDMEVSFIHYQDLGWIVKDLDK